MWPENQVDDACRDRAPGKVVVLGRLLVLGNCDSPFILDSPQPMNTIHGSPGEYDTNRSALLVLSEGLEKSVDGSMPTVDLAARGEVQNMLGNSHCRVRRNHVDGSRLQPGPVSIPFHRQRGCPVAKLCLPPLAGMVRGLLCR